MPPFLIYHLFGIEKTKEKVIEKPGLSIPVSRHKTCSFPNPTGHGNGNLLRSIFQHLFEAENVAIGEVSVSEGEQHLFYCTVSYTYTSCSAFYPTGNFNIFTRLSVSEVCSTLQVLTPSSKAKEIH